MFLYFHPAGRKEKHLSLVQPLFLFLLRVLNIQRTSGRKEIRVVIYTEVLWFGSPPLSLIRPDTIYIANTFPTRHAFLLVQGSHSFLSPLGNE